MAINTEFIGRLEREIDSLSQRIAVRRAQQHDGEADILRETEARLAHLQEMRRHLLEQSHGG
jgi:predicted kinase